jgi:hypothetical protein
MQPIYQGTGPEMLSTNNRQHLRAEPQDGRMGKGFAGPFMLTSNPTTLINPSGNVKFKKTEKTMSNKFGHKLGFWPINQYKMKYF